MSPTDKPDPVVGALYVANLLAQDEAERIEALRDDELVAEMKRDGRDPSRETDIGALLEKVKARALQQGRAVAPEPAAVPARPPPPAERVIPPVVPLRRPPRMFWSIAAMFVLAIVAIAVLKRPDTVATPQSPRETAERLRTEAIASCAGGQWAPCRQQLDDAARLDPAGESEERVKKARAAIEKNKYPGPVSP